MGSEGRTSSIAQSLRSIEPSVWLSVAIASCIFLISLPYLKNLGKHLPPGPPSWPIFGSLMYLKGELHLALWELSKKYGPVMRLGLGQFTLIVVSNAEIAEELMRQRDIDFCNRAEKTIQRSSAKWVGIDSQDIAFSEYNPHLKLLRKIVTTEIFTQSRMQASAKIRDKEVETLVHSINAQAEKGEPIAIREYLHTMTMNSICMMLFGKRYYGMDTPVTEESETFARVVRDVFETVGKLNLADLIPLLRPFDLQGIEAEWRRIRPQVEQMLMKIINEHRQRRKTQTGQMNQEQVDNRDFVDVLLTPYGNESLSDKAIMGTLFDMILGGTDTTATTIEWCMIEVVRHPDLTRKLQEEIEKVVGTGRRVQESDLPNLPYLRAYVKEIFRLHITVPINLPRLNKKASTLGGFDIPPLCTIFVNSYAIAHDPKYWTDPWEFRPERFLDSNISLAGTNFELLPFGSGRRKCVGIQLGISTVSRALASLVQAFDWSLPQGVKPQDIDMTESYKIVLRSATPLEALAKARPAVSLYGA